MLETDRRIVVGPWMSELGFEVLYWIPFLRWLTTAFSLDPDRLVAVSRGGVGHLYEDVCGSYVEIFDHLEVDQFRGLVERRWSDEGGQKQTRFGPWDQEVLTAAAAELEWEGEPVVHPAMMYRLFRRYWRGAMTLEHVLRHTRHDRFRAPALPEQFSTLPESFVAVKFYFSAAFPATAENLQLVRDTIESLASRTEVVLLHTGLAVDDHVEIDAALSDRVHRPVENVPPASNLRDQCALLSGATSFVGTYGGFSYLAPAYGVPSFSFASGNSYLSPHLELARRVAWQTGSSFTLVDTGQLGFLAGLAPTTPTSSR